MRLHASKLDLPFPSSFSPSSPAAVVSSVLFEPSSRSLSLMLVDSSALLYPSLLSSATPVIVPPPSTAACFLRLLPSATVLFLSAAPLAAGSSIQLRAWILLPRGGSAAAFSPARLDYRNDRGRSAVALPLPHGLSVRLAGSVNAFVVHSIAASQIWVFAARLDAGAEATIHLVKCAVVELTLPIYSITLSMGFMLIGEVDGVRVFPLRPLIKGEIRNSGGLGHKKASASVGDLRKKNLPNGLVIPKSRIKKSLGPDSGGGRCDCRGSTKGSAVETMADGGSAPCKLKTVRLKQDSGDHYSFFLVIRGGEFQTCKGRIGVPSSLKAVCIHMLSPKKFLILDSAGDLHVLSLNDSGTAMEPNARFSMISKLADLHPLDHVMEVQMLAALPDISSKLQFVWISDGGYSIHLISMADTEHAIGESDKDESKHKSTIISVVGAIFTSEKIQEVVPMSSNSCLVLCQGNMFIYGVV
ncbi:uncharacterized protein LOC135618686 [Musa acuminata AAA Group]|uniref:uncharacterized protein LOC135618686 n=1 Tax=Musa acuminata AAA Group TaxID=214697 RepID=UPI0031D7B8C0